MTQWIPKPSLSTNFSLAISMIVAIICSVVASDSMDSGTARPSQPQNPIIAHVTMPMVDCISYATPPAGVDASGGCVNHLFAKWLDTVGVRTVPLPWNADWESMRLVLDSVNGVLLPGGDLTGADWAMYRQNMTAVVSYALKKYEQGDPFLVWGTCQGFQILATILGNDASLLKCIYHGVGAIELPLNFTSNALGSVMFPKAVENTTYRMFATKPVTMNLHSCGVHPMEWASNDVLRSHYPLLATNLDSNGLAFGSAFEGTMSGSNILAVQFHPERSQFEFDFPQIGHTDDDLEAAWYLARLVRARLQLCTIHKYATPEEANAALIGNYPLSYTGWGKGYYWISKNPPSSVSGTTTTTTTAVTTSGPVIEKSLSSTDVWAMGLIAVFAIGMFWVALQMGIPPPPTPAVVREVIVGPVKVIGGRE